jgi:hypothetical protein
MTNIIESLNKGRIYMKYKYKYLELKRINQSYDLLELETHP